MYLTTSNAEKYIGKTLDAQKRTFGVYPYKVVKTPSGELLAVDRVGVGLKIAEPNDLFNAVYFDIVDGAKIEGEAK